MNLQYLNENNNRNHIRKPDRTTRITVMLFFNGKKIIVEKI